MPQKATAWMCNRLYGIWNNMHSRCNNPKYDSYHKYGAKGIAVCAEWAGYKAFERWALDNGYMPHLTIDRIDGTKGYSPDNCRWSTYKEQARNMKSNHYLTVNGRTLIVAEWAEEMGVHPNLIHGRLRDGWSEEEAVLIPVGLGRAARYKYKMFSKEEHTDER